jgi:hypothetical protein
VESVVLFLSWFFLKDGWGEMQYFICAEARRCGASRSEARHECIDPKGGRQQVYDLEISGARRKGGPHVSHCFLVFLTESWKVVRIVG